MNPFDQNILESEMRHSSGGKVGPLSSYTIAEDSKEEDVSFNTRSNVFGGNSPIRRLGGYAGSILSVESDDRAPSALLR